MKSKSQTNECSVEGCGRNVWSRGWCGAHYRRWKRHGDPAPDLTVKGRGTPLERFWQRVDKDGPCWLWTGGVGSHGYGETPLGLAHRASWEITNGPIPADLTVDHLCQQRLCCNPAHLELVTLAENTRRNWVHRRSSGWINPLIGRPTGRKVPKCASCRKYFVATPGARCERCAVQETEDEQEPQ